jgi:hypothetical protein
VGVAVYASVLPEEVVAILKDENYKEYARNAAHCLEMLTIIKDPQSRTMSDVGQYFIVNIKRNLLVNDHCDPEAVGREIGVMAEYERLVED